MRTFNMEAALEFKLTVPDEFVKNMREAATSDDASAFLKSAQSMHPEDDDAFILMVLSNGIKRHLRSSIINLTQGSGIGGTFAPVTLRDRTPPQHILPVLTGELNEVIPQ